MMKTTFVSLALGVSLLTCCGRGPKTAAPGEVGAAPVLRGLHPDAAVAGALFNQQPNGESALAADCEGATNTTVIVFGEERLKTVFGSDKLLTAIVPAQLTMRAGTIPVHLENEAGKSNILNFSVR